MKCDVISKESRPLVIAIVVFNFLLSLSRAGDFRAIGTIPTLFMVSYYGDHIQIEKSMRLYEIFEILSLQP